MAFKKKKEIDPDDAVIYASDKRLFQKYVTDGNLIPRADTPSPATSGG